MYYVYILRCENSSLYTGITTDVERRFNEHKDGSIKGAKYTKTHKPLGVEAVWECNSKIDASKLEYRIKKLPKSEKEELILSNEETLKLVIGDYECLFKRLL